MSKPIDADKKELLIPADVKVRDMLLKVNQLTDYKYTPQNVVMVTVEDVIEIVRELAPYTMSKLDEVHSEAAMTSNPSDTESNKKFVTLKETNKHSVISASPADTNNEELRAAIIDLDAGRHICGDEGAGCTIEEFKGNWPGAVGTYYRCKQLREHYDQVMAAITSRDQQIALAAGIKELKMLDAQRVEKTGKSKLFGTEMTWYEVPINLIWNRKAELERELATLKAQEKS